MTARLVILALPVVLALACASSGSEEALVIPETEGRDEVWVDENGQLHKTASVPFHYHAARRDFLAQRYWAASREMERAAALLGYHADRAAGTRRQNLLEAEENLRQVAKQVRAGELDAVERLDEAFGRAYQALGRRGS